MKEIADRKVVPQEWEQIGSVPDWKELPERERQDLLATLAGMLLQAGKSHDERQP